MDVTATNGGPGHQHPSAGVQVVDADGQHAKVVSIQQGNEPTALLRTAQGDEIVLPASLLQMQKDGSCRLPFGFHALRDHAEAAMQHKTEQVSVSEQTVIPVWREELQIGKRTVDTGRGIRIHKTVKEREQTVDQPLVQDELVVEHVPIGTMVESGQQPVARYEGDTLIVPVFEEVLVVQKRLRLKEEVRIIRRRHEVHAPQTVSLRSEEISIERFDEGASEDCGRGTNHIKHPS